MKSLRQISASLAVGGALLFAEPSMAADDAPLADAARSAVASVIDAAGAQVVAGSRAILVAPDLEPAASRRALLCVHLGDGAWSNPLLLTVENAAADGQTAELGGEHLVLLAMTETGVDVLTDDDPALSGRFDLAVVNLSGGLASVPPLSGFDVIAFTDGPGGGAAIRQETILFVIDAMSNASLYGDYFVVTDILGQPNQFAVFGAVVETLRSAP